MSSSLKKNWIVLGSSGAGKTTFARRLSRSLSLEHIEVDSFFWDPQWKAVTRSLLQDRLRLRLEAIEPNGWILEGHDTKLREITWPQADFVVWLDFTPSRVRLRLLGKMLCDSLTRRVLWNGNRESLKRALFGPDSRLHRGLKDARLRHDEYEAMLLNGSSPPFQIHRLRTPEDADRWLKAREPRGSKPQGSSSTTDLAGREAVLLSLTEVGLGSILHSFQIPLTGHFLSLNQIYLLSRAVRKAEGAPGACKLPATISGVAAVLKSLSPAGKKLTPMLGISAQGVFYSLGTLCLGTNLSGALLGSILSSVWAFVQPVLIYYVLYGQLLIRVAEYFTHKMNEAFHLSPEQIGRVVLGLVLVKALLASGLALFAFRGNEARAKSYEDFLLRVGMKARASRNPAALESFDNESRAFWALKARAAASDLFQPLFLISLAMTGAFLFLSDSRASTVVWILLRPIAVGFALFFSVRIFPVEKLVRGLESSRFQGFARSLNAAIDALRRI